MYLSGMGASAGGVDYTELGRDAMAALPAFDASHLAIVTVAAGGAPAKALSAPRAEIWDAYEKTKGLVGTRGIAYIGVFTTTGQAVMEKFDATVGQRPIDPYSTPASLPSPVPAPAATATVASPGALPKVTTSFAGRAASTGKVVAVAAVAAVVGLGYYAYTLRRSPRRATG